MTPKEKADELFYNYCVYLRANLLYDDEAREDAKQCALIAVNEMLFNIDVFYIDAQEYWQQVKKEIEQLDT
jgi:hypothetical protein